MCVFIYIYMRKLTHFIFQDSQMNKYIFYNIINVLTAIFDQFNASLMNKTILFADTKFLNVIVSQFPQKYFQHW